MRRASGKNEEEKGQEAQTDEGEGLDDGAGCHGETVIDDFNLFLNSDESVHWRITEIRDFIDVYPFLLLNL